MKNQTLHICNDEDCQANQNRHSDTPIQPSESKYKPCPTGACPKVPHDGNCGCKCHKPSDKIKEDWSEFNRWASNVIEHESERNWIKEYLQKALAQAKEEALEESREELETLHRVNKGLAEALAQDRERVKEEFKRRVDNSEGYYTSAIAVLEDILEKL